MGYYCASRLIIYSIMFVYFSASASPPPPPPPTIPPLFLQLVPKLSNILYVPALLEVNGTARISNDSAYP